MVTQRRESTGDRPEQPGPAAVGSRLQEVKHLRDPADAQRPRGREEAASLYRSAAPAAAKPAGHPRVPGRRLTGGHASRAALAGPTVASRPNQKDAPMFAPRHDPFRTIGNARRAARRGDYVQAERWTRLAERHPAIAERMTASGRRKRPARPHPKPAWGPILLDPNGCSRGGAPTGSATRTAWPAPARRPQPGLRVQGNVSRETLRSASSHRRNSSPAKRGRYGEAGNEGES